MGCTLIRACTLDRLNAGSEPWAIILCCQITFLEFFEALVGSAEVFVTEAVAKDPTTPRSSTTVTQEQSLISMPMSPSRGASQVSGQG